MQCRRLCAHAVLAIFLAGPALVQAAETPHWVHYRLLNNTATLPKKVVVIPASVKVFEVTAGDVSEEVPDWTNEASRNVLKAVSTRMVKAGGIQEVTMPRLSPAESAVIDEHLALYKLLVATASTTEFKHKVRRFDFALGPGLAPVLAKTGADAALMVVGRDYASTAGRKTKAVLGKIPIVNIFTGGETRLGHSFVHIGMIDLRTGDLLWMNSEYRDGSSNLRDSADADGMVDTIFSWYPGIDKYRDAYVNR